MSRLIEKIDPGLRTLREDVRVGGADGITIYVRHLDGDVEGLGQRDDVDVVALLVHRLHLLLAELLDSLPAFYEVLKELAFPLQVARGEQLQVDYQVHERVVEILNCELREALGQTSSLLLADTALNLCNSLLSSSSASKWENSKAL
ncbi:hypothetical protein MDA_GLEAN10004792 [Myotis davidii]|uniref:Uncharacterized protein n=1 Tax=Myotis davidii TaxID=225400 RepID=L5MK50_MYODS|nr:hypothetical protein MDA_GLEAN10004792 [Myotis davidii]